MSQQGLENTIRQHRERLGLSQQALGQQVGVTRQAIIAIEAGRQVPSTSLGLQLAHALGCRVEDLFLLVPAAGLEVRLAPSGSSAGSDTVQGARVALGSVEGQWVAHQLPPDGSISADGIVAAQGADRAALVRPLSGGTEPLRRNVLVAGCAPLLGALAQRVDARFFDARLRWLSASSRRALNLLGERSVHVAGLHLFDPRSGQDNISVVRETFPGQRMLIVNLTRWRQGLILPTGNPLQLREAADLLRPGLRMVRREEGAGAHKLVARLLSDLGAGDVALPGPFAAGHADVAQLVRWGAADAGVAIESVALAAGLDFIPLAEERFDLVLPAALAASAPVSRLLEALDDPNFRTEVAHLSGYDSDLTGHVTTVGGE